MVNVRRINVAEVNQSQRQSMPRCTLRVVNNLRCGVLKIHIYEGGGVEAYKLLDDSYLFFVMRWLIGRQSSECVVDFRNQRSTGDHFGG